MRRKLPWGLALVALALLASALSFWPATTLVEIPTVPTLDYPSEGVVFSLDGQGRVQSVSMSLRPRPDGTLPWPSEAQRPASTAIVPGVGCCGVRFGDSEEDVLRALGEPLHRHRQVGYSCTLFYPDMQVLLDTMMGGVLSVCTRRPNARTPQGVGIGSTRDELVRALGPPQKEPLSGEEGQRTPERTLVSVRTWYSTLAPGVLRALVVSLAVCLLLGFVPRGPVWAIMAIACAAVWIGYPLLWLAERWVDMLVRRWAYGLGDTWEDLVDRLMGRGPPSDPKRMTEMGYALQTLKDWFAAPMPKGHAFGAILGLVIGGRLASRWTQRARVIWAAACVGGTALGIAASVAEAAFAAATPWYVRWRRLWPVWPFHFAALLSVAFAGCFLLVARQRQRWRDTTRLALGLSGAGEAGSR